MAAKSQFLPQWENKIAKSEFKVDFSERLLSALYYKTDVGIIPRGGNVDKFPVPAFMNNPNWKKEIVGCYWCGTRKVEYQGICCSVECLYTFHEWCIEKAKKDSGQKFCRFPGCDQLPQEAYICCSKLHKEESDSLIIKHCGMTKRKLETELKKGPKWYDKQVNNDQRKPTKLKIPKNSSKPKQQNKPSSNECKMDIASELKERLIFDTDVGPIPRSFKKEEHLSSQFSSSPNWNREISGCYMCGKKVSDTAEYLCSKKCYFAFNEWCRRKVCNRVTFCKFPGCGKLATVYCSKQHEKETKSLSNLNSDQVDKGPTWYQCNSENPQLEVSVSKIKSSTQTKLIQFQKGELVFGEILTRFLYEKSDVGPIPRKLFERLPDSCIKTTPGNSNALIPGCYWCCENNQRIHGVTCSDKCFFLLNEWCHRKYEKSANKRLCKFPLCDSSVTSEREHCKREHFDGYQSRFTSKFGNELKSTNFALGPKWYHPDASNHIDFYDVDKPFYEFTNFFPCTHLCIDNVSWPTTEHYFQSQKFIGTPFIDFIRTRQTPRDAFDFARIPNVQKWIRIDWEKVKVSVMLKALEQKFTQNTDLGDLLIRTGDRKLFEHTHNDKFWGDGGDRKGQNMLGQLLMQVRFDLQRRIPYLPLTLNHLTHKVSSNKDSLSSQGSNRVGVKSDSAMGGENTSTYKDEFGKDFQLIINHPGSEPEPKTKIFFNKQSTTSENSQNKFPREIKVNKNPDRYIPIEFRDYLIFQTDIGIIPREKPSEQQLASPYSIYPNWKKEIHGCYCCGDKSSASTGNSCTCSYSCYLIFYEWCRRKIKSFAHITLCKFPGCMKPVVTDSDYCNNEHAQMIEDEYARVKKLKNIEKLVERDPDWYIPHHIGNPFYNSEGDVNIGTGNQNKSKTDTLPDQTPTSPSLDNFKQGDVNPGTGNQNKSKSDTLPDQTPTSSSLDNSNLMDLNSRTGNRETSKGNIPPNPHSQNFSLPTHSISSDIKINVFKFSNKLSTNLSQYTDVSLIPRRSGQQNHTSDRFPPKNPCSNVDIVGCYWCGNSNTCFEERACCVRCWLLLHEWCVRRVEQVCRLKLCGLPGCEEPRVDPCECCSIEHVKERSLLIGGVSIRLQEEIELTLGPKWYRDLTPIYFSDSGPFSELSNSFPSLLILYRMIWPTVHHCMCAQKLLGTPYLHHVRKMERLHELEEWEVRCVKWVRPDWEGVRKRVLYQALMAKFQQNCVLKGLLLRTGSRPLVCRDNVHLGDVLMSVREVLKAAAFFPSINSSFGECENNSSANSLTKVKLNEPFSVLQPNESKAYTPPDQTPTPSYLGNFEPKDINAGIDCQFESNLSPASTDVSHHGTSNDVIIGSNTRPESDALSHHSINSPLQINQSNPTNFTVENSSNPQPIHISAQWTQLHKNAPTNKSDSFEANIVPHADQASSDIPEVVQVTSGGTNERSQDPVGVVHSHPGCTDDMQ